MNNKKIVTGLNRRDFLKSIVVGTSTAALPISCRSLDHTSEKEDRLFSQFGNPPSLTRPFFRWWWNGNRVTADEISRELKLMHDAGAGGVEINPIALAKFYGDPPIRALDWLSDEWNHLVKHAVNEANKLGMKADLIVGTGWPFGGKFLERNETIQGLELSLQSLSGPSHFDKIVFDPSDANREIFSVHLYPKQLQNIDSGIDLSDKVQLDGRLKFKIPSGEYELLIVIKKYRFRQVVHGAPGADGPVLDHFNKEAVKKYLQRMSSALNPVFGGKLGNSLRAMFCDSIELKGANWTGDFAQEFEKRRGYDVRKYLPLILSEKSFSGQLADTLRRVRYDYSLTLAELFMERFILTFNEWCHENGTQSRYQAYGYPWLYTDLLDGYLVPDIPEGDQWLFNAGWVKQAEIDQIRYATWNKYASAGAHLAGRKITSCEAMTNTSGVFQASLEYIKQATDIDIITGVNSLVLHGFNYSPPEAGFPGWIRYGTYFNEHNPWWPYVKLWFDYAARLSAVFQETQPVSDIAILGPTPDVWGKHGLDRTPWILTPKYLHALWQAFNHHGYFADYVNATVLQKANFKGGKIHYGRMTYKLLVLAHAETLLPATAEALFRYAQNGGKIVFVGSIPFRSPGLMKKKENDQFVKETIAGLLEKFPQNVKYMEEPRDDGLIEWAGKIPAQFAVQPSVYISNPDEKLFFIRQKAKNRDVYFFSNADRKREINFDARFPTGNKTPWRWDAETGERKPLFYHKKRDDLKIHLAPLESMLLVFEPELQSKATPAPEINPDDFFELSGPWMAGFFPVQGESFKRGFPVLVDLAQAKELQNFAGTIIYHLEFNIDTNDDYILDLGQVHEIAEVKLNGRNLGVRWWGQRRYDTRGILKKGRNVVAIKVTTTLFNYCRSLKENRAAYFWANHGRMKKPLPCGLIGPVVLFKTTKE